MFRLQKGMNVSFTSSSLMNFVNKSLCREIMIGCPVRLIHVYYKVLATKCSLFSHNGMKHIIHLKKR
jgi:hypothetical protein